MTCLSQSVWDSWIRTRISGEVRRSGTYQLLPGDTLADLIEIYGDGLTAYADTELEVSRWQQKETVPGKVIYLSSAKKEFKEFELRNLDRINVNSNKDKLI